jgi:hypothetical protein
MPFRLLVAETPCRMTRAPLAKQRMPSGAPKLPESETGGTRSCSFTPSASRF